MALPGSPRLRAGWLRPFVPTWRATEPIPFFCFAPTYPAAPGPGFSAPGLPCPTPRSEGPTRPGPQKYPPGLKTASIPAALNDLRNQSDPPELQISLAHARTQLD